VCPSGPLDGARGPGSSLAAHGVAIHVHSDASCQDFNNQITYRIPVAREAIFTYLHCVGIDKPPVLRSSTLHEFTGCATPKTSCC
jgi:hypothetical protein